jgi:hypothetical protein
VGLQKNLSAPAMAPCGPGLRMHAAQALGSDRDFAQRNSCSDPNPGNGGRSVCACSSCLGRRIPGRDDGRQVSARSCKSLVLKAAIQRLNSAAAKAGMHAFPEDGCRDVRPAAQYLSLASPRERHQREGDPAVRDPFAALRGNLRCALQAGFAQTRFAQTARGPDPPEAVLLGTARGEGSQTTLRAIAALGSGLRTGRGAGIGVGSRCSAAKLVLRPQSRNHGRGLMDRCTLS